MMSPEIKRLLLLALPLSAASLSAESQTVTKRIDKKIGQVQFHQYPVAGAEGMEKDALDCISGYDALKNALIVAPIIKRPQGSHELYEADLLSPDLRKICTTKIPISGQSLSKKSRGTTLACEYIEDTLYLAIKVLANLPMSR